MVRNGGVPYVHAPKFHEHVLGGCDGWETAAGRGRGRRAGHGQRRACTASHVHAHVARVASKEASGGCTRRAKHVRMTCWMTTLRGRSQWRRAAFDARHWRPRVARRRGGAKTHARRVDDGRAAARAKPVQTAASGRYLAAGEICAPGRVFFFAREGAVFGLVARARFSTTSARCISESTLYLGTVGAACR